MKPIYTAAFTTGGKITDLIENVNWTNAQFARGECFMSAVEREYQYIDNGPVYKSTAFNPLVRDIMSAINTKYNYNLDVCFLNYYINDTKALGWHSDDSTPINQEEPIAVVSFGQAREIWCKPIDYKGVIPAEWKQLLDDGSLFIMPAGMQATHKHKIPKGDCRMGPRISLTYRSWRKDL